MQKHLTTALATRQTVPDQPDAVGSTLPYTVYRIARRVCVSLAQAALIAELLNLATEPHHG